MIQNAIILAAGRGEKLWPYRDTNAKSALLIGNRPLIQWQLDSLAAVGVTRVAVVVGFLDGMVRNACSQWQSKNPDKIALSFVEQKAPTGTADAALLGIRCLGCSGDPVFVVPGDLYFHSDDFAQVAKQPIPSVLVSTFPSSHIQETIRAEVREGKVLEVCAHSRAASTDSRQLTGLMSLPQGFESRLASTPDIPTCVEIGGMAPVNREIAETLHQWILGGGSLLAVEAQHTVIDIDRPWDFLEANGLSAIWQTEGLKGNHLEEGASIDPSARIQGSVWLGKGSKIGPGVIVYGNARVGENTTITDGAYIDESVVVGDGCQIWRGGLVGKNTVIGHRCHVGHGAEFEGVMLPESYSYHYGEYWGVLGRCADLGAATVCGTLRFDDGQTLHRVRGRKETPRYHANATYLGDYVRTGVNAILMPGVKVGPYSLIGAGVLLSEDVPNNTSVYLEQVQKRGNWGPERYSW